MRIGLIIADFEIHYCTSFIHTARVKYGVDFNTSNVDTLGLKLIELKEKIQTNQFNDVHVGFEITLEHVLHVEHLLNEILSRYKEVFSYLPSNRKIYTINQKLRESEIPQIAEMAKEVVQKILIPETPPKQTKAEKRKAAAKAISQRRALEYVKKKSAKNKE